MIEQKLRKYGTGTFKTVVMHGGPGTPGEMKPVAERLSTDKGVLEPFQQAQSIEVLVDELRDILIQYGMPPFTLLGHSWGAWLSYIFAAIHSDLVEKVILVGSPPFREKYASEITDTRLKRLEGKERAEAEVLFNTLERNSGDVQRGALAWVRKLTRKADSYNPFPTDESVQVEIQPETYRKVWREAEEVRKSGELLELGEYIESPVVAIHGSYDPHPAEGVRDPLSRVLGDFKFVLLDKCGHTPWLEREAKDKFYAILEGILG
ncbi:MAG: alpha/beta fold hydrolase [Candidatus Bipolaricaulia bacterium]